MSASPAYVFSANYLQPWGDPEQARTINVNLVSGTYARGQVVGQVTTTAADDVQTITITGTSGTWTALARGNTATFQFNDSAATIQTWLDSVYGVGNSIATQTGSGPYVTVITFTGILAAQTITPIVVTDVTLAGSGHAAANVHTTPGVVGTGNYGAYAHGNSDGTQVGKGFLMYPCTVDASGNVTISAEIPGLTERGVPMYYCGAFRAEDLVGLPTSGNLVVDLPGARISRGNLLSGVLVLPG